MVSLLQRYDLGETSNKPRNLPDPGRPTGRNGSLGGIRYRRSPTYSATSIHQQPQPTSFFIFIFIFYIFAENAKRKRRKKRKADKIKGKLDETIL